MARLFADENFPWPVVEALRQRGHDVGTLTDVGHAGMGLPDEAILALAAADGRALLTLNRKHFARLHASASHAGIVVCTVDLDFDGQAARIHAAVDNTPLAGVLLRINRPSNR